MAEIKCPNCGKTFQIDESEYSKIVNQVKNAEFDKELEEHLKMHDKEKDLEIETLKQEISGTKEKLTLEAEKTLQEEIASREARIKALEAEKKASEEQAKRNLEEQINLAVKNKEVEIQGLKQQLSTTEERVRMEEEEKARSLKQTIDAKNNEIEGLKSKAEIDKQQAELDYKERLKEESNKKDSEISQKDSEISRLTLELENEKNFKRSQSVKMIGESLEQYCATEFEKNRALGFRNAYFAKDNEVKDGSKGDFIFKDYDDDGTEIISVMFDMKNENDVSATKHKNADFLKELDKDRNLKNCEYAVLVSMLEPDNDLYNNGIVDVSYMYPKMYVIRPQFFIPMITLLRNAALNSISDRKALIAKQNENIDLTHFEEDFDDFKTSFWNTYKNAKNRHEDAVKQIDDAISHLQQIRGLLTTSDSHLDAAANKVDQISIKKLTKRAPSVAQKLEDVKNN